MKKILIADDDKSIRFLLEFTFNQENFEVITVEDGLMAYELAQTGVFDALVLDLMMPGLSGIEVSQKLRKNNIYTPILILTAKDDSTTMLKGFDSGVDDYMYKPFSTPELLARTKSLIRRSLNYQKKDEKFVQIDDLKVDLIKKQVYLADQEINLTKREFDLLSYLIENQNIPLSRSEILDRFWGQSNDIAYTRIVEVHISKLREKIEKDPKNPQYIKTKRGFGYIFKEADK
ncbi:response regulator transcription factor [Streptococcaceae bacterium ESL0687]|nr:response regulator transcription factor [Streptococcaceae bacterium ESL0687]